MISSLFKSKRTWTAETHDGGTNVFVWPNNDLIEHEHGEDCICGPTVELVEREGMPDAWLYTHSSLDGRERDEQQTPVAFVRAWFAGAAVAVLIVIQFIIEVRRRRKGG